MTEFPTLSGARQVGVRSVGPRLLGSGARSPSPDGCRMSHYWPILIYVPAVLLLIFTLSFITAVWDRKEKRKAQRH